MALAMRSDRSYENKMLSQAMSRVFQGHPPCYLRSPLRRPMTAFIRSAPRGIPTSNTNSPTAILTRQRAPPKTDTDSIHAVDNQGGNDCLPRIHQRGISPVYVRAAARMFTMPNVSLPLIR
jgi:hypothetical protein